MTSAPPDDPTAAALLFRPVPAPARARIRRDMHSLLGPWPEELDSLSWWELADPAAGPDAPASAAAGTRLLGGGATVELAAVLVAAAAEPSAEGPAAAELLLVDLFGALRRTSARTLVAGVPGAAPAAVALLSAAGMTMTHVERVASSALLWFSVDL